MKSKIGYLLSGPMPSTFTTALHTNVLKTTEYDLQKLWMIESIGTSPITVNSSSNSPTLTCTSLAFQMEHTLLNSPGNQTTYRYQPIFPYVKEERDH